VQQLFIPLLLAQQLKTIFKSKVPLISSDRNNIGLQKFIPQTINNSFLKD